ncbi:adenosylcobalamin-dependent ribonucleoside-diphosphate reductase [Candidatus Bathyarchaeota archaeon]|nr:adenosylcobalamin-dependent ribonucleoside-diphosphate reductase [Candidatus Bathyarchaeota archaeon]
MPPSKVIKRDGRIVDFDKNRIVEAIWKAFQATGLENRSLAERLGNEVVKVLDKTFGAGSTPHVEQIQDIVEKVLVRNGLYEAAKAYILYRRRRSEIREIKRMLGVVDDMKLTLNAVTVLKSRYLLKDERGNIVETPKQMLMRVSRYIGLVDAFYWSDVYDKDGRQPVRQVEKFEYKPGKAGLTSYELEMMKRLYNRLGKEGKMRVSFEELLSLVEERWDTLYENVIDVFFQVMANRYFLPNSPTLMNANAPLGQLSACFVLPVHDSIESIFESLKNTALIHKSGGGTGFNFSKLRPKGDVVRSTSGVASGPVSFMRIYDVATDVIKQGGKRRGANMGILRVDHPDIIDFVYAKSEEGALRNFNISVAVTDEFMEAVEKGAEFKLVNPRTGKPVQEVNARYLFDMIVYNAWRSGDPGIIFLDTVNRHNPTPRLGTIEATNPCGEQPLLPYESCNLGSINLERMVKFERGRWVVDWRKLREVVRVATHFLDNVIDANHFPIPEIEETTLRTRKIGLGVMGWANMLFRLGIPYDSEEAIELARRIMEYINYHSKLMSAELAEVRGSFPAFKGSIYDSENPRMPFEAEGEVKHYTLDWSRVREAVKKHGIRNATTTTVAPTGTISIIAGTSSGIEPVFALVYSRTVLGGVRLFEVNTVLEEVLKERGVYSDEVMAEISKTGMLSHIEGLPEDIRRVFVTALEVDVDWHVKMQTAFQEFTDNAVSKTINLRPDASPEDVKKAFLLAYRLGCKGITVYRYGSKGEQVLELGVKPRRRTTERVLPVGVKPPEGCPRESCGVE